MTLPVVPKPLPESGLREAIGALGGQPQSPAVSALDLLNSYAVVFVVAFLVALLSTPLVRRLALHVLECESSYGRSALLKDINLKQA